jgi:Fe-S protein assembly co-chaperone HscB
MLIPARIQLPVCCSDKPTFDLDPAALEKRYKLLQWQLHPDKTTLRSQEEQQFSAEQATRVNQAYGVLRRPLSRANYMVRFIGSQAVVSAEQTGSWMHCLLIME